MSSASSRRERSAIVYWLDRWRMLTPSQQQAVFAALQRAERDSMRCAERARSKGTAPEPFGLHHRRNAIRHAANAGAANIALGLLRAGGCLP